MSTDHTDRYIALKQNISQELGHNLERFALVAFGPDGEFFWGADYGGLTPEQRRKMVNYLRTLARDIAKS